MWLSALGAGMQSFGNSMSEIKETERLEKKEAAAKKALEEAERKRVARRQVYLKQPDYTQGPSHVDKPTWMEKSFNSNDEQIKERRLDESELFAIEQEEKINQASAERQQRKDEQEEKRINASIAASTASAGASNARAQKYKAEGLAAPEKATTRVERDVDYLLKELSSLEGDNSDAIAAAQIAMSQSDFDKAQNILRNRLREKRLVSAKSGRISAVPQ